MLPYFYNVKSIKTIANGSNNIDRVHEGFFARVQIGNSWLVVMSQLQQGIEPTAIHLDDNLLLHRQVEFTLIYEFISLAFLGHLSHSGDLLLWVGVRRRAS